MKSNYPQELWQLWRKTEFLRMFWFGQVFSQLYGHQSLCSIHVIKSTHPNFEHTKYEPDMSNHARKKWGVKIAPVFRTPCSLCPFHKKEPIMQSASSFMECSYLLLCDLPRPLLHQFPGICSGTDVLHDRGNRAWSRSGSRYSTLELRNKR